MKFTHLHTHSHYSLLDGLPKIDELLDYAKELNMDSLALTDHGVLYGAVEFYKKAIEKGIKPIIGCEMYVAQESMLQKRPGIDDKRYHLILLAKNEEGYKNLIKLITKAHLEGFYYKPRIDEELLRQHSSGLIAQTACLAGKIPSLIMAKKFDEAKNLALKYQKIFGKENFYLEIQHHENIKEQKIVNNVLIDFSKKLNIPLVATNDIHYLKPEDAEAQDILMLINTGADPNDPERLTMKTDNFCMRKPAEMAELFKDTPEAIENTQKIAEMCNFQFELGKTKLPHFPLPEGKSSEEYIRDLCNLGLKKRGFEGKKEVLERLEYELSVIEKTGFGSYFLIVQDFVNWAKSNGIVVGPGRGCFLPNTKILLGNGRQKNIEDVESGETVITHLSNTKKVQNNLHYDIDEEIAIINSKMPVNKLKLTKDHKIFAAKANFCAVKNTKKTLCKPSCSRSCKNKLWKNYELKWIEAKNLKKGDFLVYPITKKSKQDNKVFDLAKLRLDNSLKSNFNSVWYEVGTNKIIQARIPRQIKLDKNFAKFLGFYVAEGWNRSWQRGTAIGFGFHNKEKEFAHEIEHLFKEIFKLKTSEIYHKSRNSLQVYAYSLIVGKFLEKLCGRGALNKHIPNEILNSSADIKIAFLTNLFKGDGSRKDRMRISFDSVSYDLASQVKMLLAQLGIMSSIKSRKYKNKNWHTGYKLTVSGKQLFEFNKLFHDFQISIISQKFYRNDTFIKDGYIWFPIQNISFEKYKGKVYDLTIKNDRSYVANDIAVHNSAPGSLVSYLLNITNVDPLKYNLLFERFLNPERISFPDIDLDFTDTRRDEVIEYVAQKYGRNKVAQIITFGTMAARAAIRDVGRATGLSYSFCDQVAKMIPMGFTLDETLAKIAEFRQLYMSDSQARNLIDFAKKLEGVARHASTHACGVVVAKDALETIVPLQHPTQSDEGIVTQYEMHCIEDLGLLKMDFLGLKNLTIIENTLKIIKKNHDVDINIDNIPFDDKETYKLLQKGNTAGIFQLEGQGMTRYLVEMKPTEFEDLIAMVALYRPGPMELIPSYIKRKQKKEPIEFLHPKMENSLKATYGIMIYQEQLMQIAREMAGFTLGEADILRKAVGKKIKKLLMEQKEKLVEGMIKNSIDKKIAQQIWDWILPFASYGFNRCLAGDTEIIDGKTGEILKIKEIAKGKNFTKIFSLNTDTLKLQNSSPIRAFKNGVKPVYEVTTRLGKKIKATQNHPFFTINGWKNLSELKIGNRIAMARRLLLKNNGLSGIRDFQLIVLGYALAEGNLCHPSGFYIYSIDERELMDYKIALEKFPNTTATFNRGKRAVSVYSKRTDLRKPCGAVDWMKKIGMYGKKATQKDFPNFVFQLSEKQIALLLAKMFQGDGCVNFKKGRPQIFYATSSEKLVRQLQHLFLRLGVVCTIHYKKFKYRQQIKNGYTLTINRYENIENFHRYIGPHLIGEKKAILEKIIKTHPIISKKIKDYSARESKDTVPAEVREVIKSEIKKHGYSSLKKYAKENGFSERLLWKDLRKKGYLRETLLMIGKKLNSRKILKYAQSDLYWDEIVKIIPVGKEETFDLTIKDTHNFLANDFVVHNSHAASYATIAYETAYLKTHYPTEFMTALLTADQNDIERIAVVIDECKKMEISVLPPDINESRKDFTTVKENVIRFGLVAIKNVGNNVVEEIYEERKTSGPYQSIADFVSRLSSKVLNKKSMESLIKAGAFDTLSERNLLLLNLEQLLENSREIQKSKLNNQRDLFGGKIKLERTVPLKPATPATNQEKLKWEKELLGLYVSSHPMEAYQKTFEKKTTPINKIEKEMIGKTIKVAGITARIKKIVTKSGSPMVFMNLEDLTGKIEVIVFTSVIAPNPEIFKEEGKVVVVTGRVDNRNGGELKLVAQGIEEIVEK